VARDRRSRYIQMARQTAAKYGVPPRLFLSMIEHESAWNPAAISSSGAIGLGQLMPRTAKSLGVDPTNPRENLDGAARYIHSLYSGSWREALRAYNFGPSGAAENPDNGSEYADSILAGRSKYRQLPSAGPAAAKGSGPFPGHIGLTPTAHAISFAQLVAAVLPDDPAFQQWARVVDVPDPVVQKQGIVSPKGSVIRVAVPTGEAQGVIGAAQSQLGKPYVFGSGPDTSSFDCSDLIQWAYAQSGINIPRTTYQQIHVGRGVAWKDLQPGDLIFPTTHHVVMYVGNGKVIAAPHTGTVVQYQPVSDFSNPVAIRRVLP
jgi:NlpC/P60 family/Transglycosylase SLT domain